MKVIKGQPLFSTLEDSQGEQRDKQFLSDLLKSMPSRFPLGQHHDAALPYCGHIENLSLKKIPESPNEWMIVGDVHLNTNADYSGFKGFSYSSTEIVKRQKEPLGALYVPYPFYTDNKIISEILAYDPQLNAGRWIKKNSDPGHLSLIVSLVLFTLQPVWKKTYDKTVWPFLKRSIDKYLKGHFKKNPLDYGFGIKGHKGEKINVYFISDRKSIRRTFTKSRIGDGLDKAINFISNDSKAKNIGVSLIKLHFENEIKGYEIHSVQYTDGTILSIVV